MMELTIKNYHSIEANKIFMSCHQFSDFMNCPAKEVAILNGEWTVEDKDVFAIGSYIDTALLTPDRMDEFLATDQAALLFNKNGKPNAKMDQAKACIERCQRDPFFMSYLVGDPQVIMTAEFPEGSGVMWKIMMDIKNKERERLVDLKSVGKSFHDEDRLQFWTILHELDKRGGDPPTVQWGRGPWYEVFRYYRQAALYRHIASLVDGIDYEFYLAAVTKQDPPDIDIFFMPSESRFESELKIIKQCLPFIMSWKTGEKEAPRCEDCDYCRATKIASLQTADSKVVY